MLAKEDRGGQKYEGNTGTIEIWDKVELKTQLFSEMTSTVPLPKQH